MHMLTRTAPPLLRLPQMKEQRLRDAGAQLDDIQADAGISLHVWFEFIT